MANFAERMRSLRKEKGLKKTEVAKGTGLDRSTVTNYESGKRDNPTAETLQRIADYFDVSIDYLTGKTDYFVHCSRVYIIILSHLCILH